MSDKKAARQEGRGVHYERVLVREGPLSPYWWGRLVSREEMRELFPDKQSPLDPEDELSESLGSWGGRGAP